MLRCEVWSVSESKEEQGVFVVKQLVVRVNKNTRRVVNNRFNECVEAGGSLRACQVKQTLQIRLLKCKMLSFPFDPLRLRVLLSSAHPFLPITRHNIFSNPVWSLLRLFLKARWSRRALLLFINGASKRMKNTDLISRRAASCVHLKDFFLSLKLF